MKIVTGAKGYEHVTSNNDGEFNQSIYGDRLVVLPNGSQLGYELIGSTLLRVKDGDLVLQGRHALIEPGFYDDISIDAGQSGYNRIDLVVAHYEIDAEGHEDITLQLIKGSVTSGEPIEPQYTTGTIRTGSDIVEAPLYRIDITGTNVAVTMVAVKSEQDILTQINGKQANVTGAASSIVTNNLSNNKAVVTNLQGKLVASNTTATDIDNLQGTTGNVQTQLNGKQATITGAGSTVTTANFSPSKVVVTNESGKLAESTIDTTKLGYLSGVTSDIQAQLDSKNLEKGSTFNAGNVLVTNEEKKVITSNVTAQQLGYINSVTSNVQTQLDNKAPKGSTWNTHRVVVTDDNKNAITSGVTDTELGYLSGVTSKVQTQLNGKQATITGSASSVTSTNLTKERALVTNSNQKIAVANTTLTELNYVHGVTGAIQTQLNSKANAGGWTASRVMGSSANGNIYATGINLTQLGYLSGATSNIQTQLNAKVNTNKVTIAQASTNGMVSSINLSKETNTRLGTFTLPAGSYCITATATFAAADNSNGYDASIWIADTATGSARNQASIVEQFVYQWSFATLQVTAYLSLSASTTLYIVGWHNSTKAKQVKNVRLGYLGIKD